MHPCLLRRILHDRERPGLWSTCSHREESSSKCAALPQASALRTSPALTSIPVSPAASYPEIGRLRPRNCRAVSIEPAELLLHSAGDIDSRSLQSTNHEQYGNALRHTLATALLEKVWTTEDVALVLGSTPDIIRRHYAQWTVQGQERITSLAQDVWDVRFLSGSKNSAVTVDSEDVNLVDGMGFECLSTTEDQ